MRRVAIVAALAASACRALELDIGMLSGERCAALGRALDVRRPRRADATECVTVYGFDDNIRRHAMIGVARRHALTGEAFKRCATALYVDCGGAPARSSLVVSYRDTPHVGFDCASRVLDEALDTVPTVWPANATAQLARALRSLSGGGAFALRRVARECDTSSYVAAAPLVAALLWLGFVVCATRASTERWCRRVFR